MFKQRDLGKLNRDLSKVLVLDFEGRGSDVYSKHPENILRMGGKKWYG